jgi:hypothetical protein
MMYSNVAPKNVCRFSCLNTSILCVCVDLQEMIEYGRQQQRSLIQQREQMMAEIRKESAQLMKEFEKKNQELSVALKTEIVQYMTANLAPL